MKIVENARDVWYHYSTQALAFVAIAQTSWVAYPEDWKAALPVWVSPLLAKVIGSVAALGLVGKFVKQDVPEHGKDAAP